MYQRSADLFLGVPFNIASYALLTHMLAQICDLKVADLVWSAGDVHLYSNHMDQVRLQLERDERGLPNLKLPNFKSLDEVLDSSVNDYVLLSYDPWPAIKAPMAV
jgi:thymidylate synthase